MINRLSRALSVRVSRRVRHFIQAALAFFVASTACIHAQQAPSGTTFSFINTLMPTPSTLVSNPGHLRIDSSFTYTLNSNAGTLVRQGAVRMLHRIEMSTGVSLVKTPSTNGREVTLAIEVLTPSPEGPPQLGQDESYTLDVEDHRISLRAKTWIGALRGMETLPQLVQPLDAEFVIPAVHIEDAPRFAWRGLMLDSGRHFLPPDVIYRTLDGMATVKMNVLHLHLTEDQGFRVESRIFPKLQSEGSDGLYYTQQTMRDIIAYAAARGIRVVPEFDVPGHSTSWLVGYPELGSAPGPYSIARKFGVHDAALDPTRESTYRFLDAFFGEMSHLFPDAYMHIGGDESNGKEWRANPQIQAFMKANGMKTTQELQAYFNRRVQKILAKHNKQMIGWDEVLSPALGSGVVIQNWHGTEFLINAARQGYGGLYSHPYYLDHMYTAEQMFLADPLPVGSQLTPDQRRRILGGEACMWGEMVTPETIDSRIWPRAAAVAERLWSPATDQNVNDMYRRSAIESLRLEAIGIPLRSESERGLSQLAGTPVHQALDLFASTLQPVDFHVRGHEQHPSPFTVFDRLVDSVRPDPPLRHEFELLVDSSLQRDATAIEQLESIFHSWVNAAPSLDRLAANSPLLQEASGHIAQWPRLGTLGIEAISLRRSGNSVSPGWCDRQASVLREAEKPKELVDFVVLTPLQRLVDAACTADKGVTLSRSGEAK